MRNTMGNVLWGIAFIVLGIGFAGNALGIWNFNLFFDGWWTLFIIVPCSISIVQNGVGTGNIIGLIIGIMLLMSSQNIINGATVGDLIIPIILIVVGLNFLLKGSNGKARKVEKTMYSNGKVAADLSAVFGGRTVNYQNEVFSGATVNAIFGGVKLDLRNAIIEEDVVINASAIFGGVDIFLPNDVQVKVSSVPIFGGVSNKAPYSNGPVKAVVYVNATCMFGGVDIK